MAVKENGVLTNGSTSKYVQPPRSTESRRATRSTATWIALTSVRLSFWYLIVTCLVRCPTDLSAIDQNSPRVCQPYAKSLAVVKPYVEPYYNTYASPYVEKAKPYAEDLNKKVIAPASEFGQLKYKQLAAPRIADVKNFGQQQWETLVLPQARTAQKKAHEVYDTQLASHVEKSFAVVEPYYGRARNGIVDINEKHILPAINNTKPYLLDTYSASQGVLVDSVIPYVRWAWSTTVVFIDGTLWPHVRALYGDNVRPQLDLISDRIFRYQESRKLKASMETLDSSISASSSISESTATPLLQETLTETSEQVPVKTKLTAEEQIAAARDRIATDLNTWQEKFALAADKGSEDLDARVGDLIKSLIHSEVDGEGHRLLTALNKTVALEISSYKSKIVDAVSKLTEESSVSDVESAGKGLQDIIRKHANAVRERATALRQWHSDFEALVMRRAHASAESTLDVLDSIRDLGLQEIGMRWAWMDGVTYKDWQKYHNLRKQFDSWRDEVREVATKHEMVVSAKSVSGQLLEDAMDIASEAAQELVRLRDVAKWKVHALDSTDNFETRDLPLTASAASVASNVADKVESVKSKVTGGGEPAVESVIESAVEVSDVTSEVGESVSEGLDSAASITASIAEEISENVDSATEVVPSSSKVFAGAMAQEVKAREPVYDDVVDDDSAAYSEKLQSIVNDAGDRYADVSKAVSEALLGTAQGTVESVSSVATDKYSSALAAASSALYGTTGVADSLTDAASRRYSQAVIAASAIIYGTPTPASESVASQANSAYSQAVAHASSQYEQAKAIVSAKISGTPKPVHEEMLSSVESAYSGSLAIASQKLDSALSLAAEKYSSLASVTNAFSRPTQGPLESISSVASSNLQAALSVASQRYSEAKDAVGPSPTPVHEQYLLEARQQYYGAMGIAHERYSDFVSAASGAVYGTPTPVLNKLSEAASQAVYGTPTPILSGISSQASEAVYGTSDPVYVGAISAASAKLAAASSAASASAEAFVSAARSAVGAESKSPVQSVLDEGSSRYDAAILAASKAFSDASYAASTALYGTTTGVAESVASQASENWDALVSRASEQIYGAPTPVITSVTSKVAEQLSGATDAAAAQFASVQTLFSELLIGREPDFTESVMQRLSSAYTGYASAAGQAYESASSVAGEAYESASSVVTSYFTPPPEIETILQAASENLQAVIDAASVQIHGTSKGVVEQARSSVDEAYSSVSTAASQKVYGTEAGYAEAAQSSISQALASAQQGLSNAIYGTSTGSVESATSAAQEAYATASSVVAENVAAAGSAVQDGYSAAAAKVSEAIYGPEQGALESAQSRLMAAVESAQARLSEFSASAGSSASAVIEAAKEQVEKLTRKDEL